MSPLPCRSAGSEPVRHAITACAILAALLAGGVAPAQRRGDTTAEIRIALPDGIRPSVSVSPGQGAIVLDLPEGAEFPEDFNASSGGMLGGHTVETSDGRVKLEIDQLQGTLERVDYAPDAVVLHFRSGLLPAAAAVARDHYLLGADDKILITVHNHPDLTTELDVTDTGWITAPLVGQVKAAGLTPSQLAARLAELLDGAYLVKPQVDVGVKEFNSQWVVVQGEVLAPGRIALRGGTRLKEVLGEAEGFGNEAGEVITITRRVPGTTQTRMLYISRDDFENGKSNPTLMNGDAINVKRAEYCYVQGEVREAGRVRIERGMTLLRVISMARGLTDWADKKNIRVLYNDGTIPAERTYNMNQIVRGKVEDPVIRGGEVVIVKKRFL